MATLLGKAPSATDSTRKQSATRDDPPSVGDFAALSRVLLGSRSADGVRALARTGENAGRSVGTGRLLDLLRDNEVPDDAALVGVVRPDCIAVDFDGTAWLLPHVLDAAGAVGASVVHLATSGSPESVHAVLAAPTAHGHAELLAAVDRLRVWSGAGARELDVRGRSPLRLPGSPSLKSHGCPVVPCDEWLTPITAKEATSRAVAALKHAGLPRHPKQVPGAAPAVSGMIPRRVDDVPLVESLRGRLVSSHRGFVLSDEARAALAKAPSRGVDRSLHALKVGRLLWRDGAREFDDVAALVLAAPAFASWRGTRGDVREECRRRWLMERANWLAWNPDMSPAEVALHDDVERAAYGLPDDLVPVVLALVEFSRMSTTRDALPVAVRDLVGWGVAGTAETAHQRLSALHELGVLTRVRSYFDGPADEATLWKINAPQTWEPIPDTNLTSGTHSLMLLPAALGPASPLGWTLNQGELNLLRSYMLGDSAFLETSGFHAPSERTVRRRHSRLVDLGLLVRVKRGRLVEYRAAVDSCDDLRGLPVWVEAMEVYRTRCEVVAGDRDAWADWLADNRGVLDGNEGSRADRAVVVSQWSGDAFEAVEVRESGVTVRRTTYEPVGGDPGLGAAAAAGFAYGDAVRAGPGVIECSGDP